MSNQVEFLINEFWILSWNASVQRALKYDKSALDAERQQFRESVVNCCMDNIIPHYKSPTSEQEHLRNIVKIRDYAMQCSRESFFELPYNIGIAQKLLNLQLKYMWCAGYIKKPPHCPVDRIILSKTELKGKMNWTQIETIDEYEKAILAIRKEAGSQDIADWELDVFDRRGGI